MPCSSSGSLRVYAPFPFREVGGDFTVNAVSSQARLQSRTLKSSPGPSKVKFNANWSVTRVKSKFSKKWARVLHLCLLDRIVPHNENACE
jgi:hypothetical protein